MIDMIYNLRVGDIHAAEFSDEFITSAIKQLALLFENPSKERCCVLSRFLVQTDQIILLPK